MSKSEAIAALKALRRRRTACYFLPPKAKRLLEAVSVSRAELTAIIRLLEAK